MRWLRMIVMAFVLPIAWLAAASDLTVKVIGGRTSPDPAMPALSWIPDPRMPIDRAHLGY